MPVPEGILARKFGFVEMGVSYHGRVLGAVCNWYKAVICGPRFVVF